MVRAAFLPFGELTDINMPLDASSSKHRGFCFVQYEEKVRSARRLGGATPAARSLRLRTVSLRAGHTCGAYADQDVRVMLLLVLCDRRTMPRTRSIT